MKKTNYLSIVFAIIAIIFAILFFNKKSLKTTLNAEQLKEVEKRFFNNPEYLKADVDFVKPVPIDDVPEALESIKTLTSSKIDLDSSWITYSTINLTDYVKKFNSAIKKWEVNYEKDYDSSKFIWSIGLYPNLKVVDGKKLVDFYVIPTLKEKKGKNENNDKKFAYNMVDSMRNPSKSLFKAVDSFVYNFGDLHP